MVPTVRFVEKFRNRTYCRFWEIIPLQPVRNPIQWLQRFMDQWTWNLFPPATVCSIN